MSPRVRALVGSFISLGLVALAAFAIRRELAGHGYHELAATFRALPPNSILLASLATLCSYALVAGYDLLAIRHFGLAIAPRRAALASLVGFTFSNTAGHGWFVGAPARYRIYESLGCTVADVARITLFGAATFWAGFALLAGLLFTVWPIPTASLPLLGGLGDTRPLGLLILALASLYLVLAASSGGRARHLGRLVVRLPRPGLAAAQLALGALDLAVSGCALYALLPASAQSSLPRFLALYLLALLAGNLSLVPGGLGVFEAAILLLAPDGAHALVAPLLAYRVIYYWIPFAGAVGMLALGEGLTRWPLLGGIGRGLRRAFAAVAPTAAAIATLGAGALLLASGATPAIPQRLTHLRALLPLVEISHFTGSLLGTALLLLAYGLFRRLDSAWSMALAATLLGAATSLGKGLDWEESLLLVVVAILLLLSRKSFYRRGSLLSEPLTPGWIAAVVALLGASIWLGFFAHRHVEYSDQLWYHFALHADAPRFLRASAGAVATALLFGVARLAGRARSRAPLASEADLEEIAPLVAASPETGAHLALLGDKRFLMSADRTAFLMYAVRGRTWVAMGDPIGPPVQRRELAHRFREQADRHDAWPVFYQVRAENLALYLDLGLSLAKLGEEARVALSEFSLEGAEGKSFRNLLHRFERDGIEVEIVPAPAVPDLLPELRTISDEWLSGKQTREKGFSLGSFDEAYLRRGPVACVRRDGETIAFANLWLGAEREAASVDLMRHLDAAPNGVMEFLFLRLMLWARHQGYRWFDLGMAPLAGLERGHFAPAWHRLAGIAFRHGETFYNFQGIRRFKEKFHPVWEGRYLASPGGIALPRVLTDVAALIGGGLAGIFRR